MKNTYNAIDCKCNQGLDSEIIKNYNAIQNNEVDIIELYNLIESQQTDWKIEKRRNHLLVFIGDTCYTIQAMIGDDPRKRIPALIMALKKLLDHHRELINEKLNISIKNKNAITALNY